MGLDKETSAFRDICQNSRFALISHGTELDPFFNYANEACLEAFARSYDELCALPSKMSVVLRSEDEDLRIELLRRVTTDGYVDDATGIRVRGDQKYIRFVNAQVWNCYDENEEYYGQACLFDTNKTEIASNFD